MSRFQVDGVWYRRDDMGENLEFGTNNKSGTLTRFSALCSSLKKRGKKIKGKQKEETREKENEKDLVQKFLRQNQGSRNPYDCCFTFKENPLLLL